ncbi:MAG: amino acid ABC transporter permease [Bifidobacteriaceae bacterium]|jgi:polar amino acid transport system permease protein|nr:amino acid ABC transporter permease [Bifidobacteriaceae bacterium]
MYNDFITIVTSGNNVQRLFNGLLVTLEISIAASLLSIFFGTFFGFLLSSKNKIIKIISKLYLETFRLIPQLVILFVVYYGVSSELKITLKPIPTAIFVFTLWGLAEMGDLVRAGIKTVPIGQVEAAQAIGLSNSQVSKMIKIPFMLRQITPQAINLVTRIIKTSSIVPLIGIMDITKVGQSIIDLYRMKLPDASFIVYGIIFVVYFLICFMISLLAKRLEKKLC